MTHSERYIIDRGTWAIMAGQLLAQAVRDAGSTRKASKVLGVPRSTIGAWVRRHRARGTWPEEAAPVSTALPETAEAPEAEHLRQQEDHLELARAVLDEANGGRPDFAGFAQGLRVEADWHETSVETARELRRLADEVDRVAREVGFVDPDADPVGLDPTPARDSGVYFGHKWRRCKICKLAVYTTKDGKLSSHIAVAHPWGDWAIPSVGQRKSRERCAGSGDTKEER